MGRVYVITTKFYYHPRMLAYDFGPQHPLRPERLRRTIELLSHLVPKLPIEDPGQGDVNDVLLVHDSNYVAVVQAASCGDLSGAANTGAAGFGPGDNPLFAGMYEASLAYCAGTAAAARDVSAGQRLAFNIAGGLHHARHAQASGFCVFNDPAIACAILRQTYDRVAYVDIDVHHGDGVQWLFYDDPNVLTCSIHQSGSSLYPGTGFVEEVGKFNTSINVPLPPGITGDVWLNAFDTGVIGAIKQFNPQAIVLQMGTDAHYLDPLAHLQVTAQEWLDAVKHIHALKIPIVAVGGGGYCATTVPRMWTAAILTLLDKSVPDLVPEPYASEWSMPLFFDERLPSPRLQGEKEARQVLDYLEKQIIPKIGTAA